MEILLENYKLILGIIILVAVFVFAVFKFVSQPTSKQKLQIKAVLLILVIESEKMLGSGTGRLKFSYVYSELLSKFTWLKYIPLSVIEKLIDESLEEMRHLLETNSNVAEIVNKGEVLNNK